MEASVRYFRNKGKGRPMTKKSTQGGSQYQEPVPVWQDFSKLPSPDRFGTYWFGKPGTSESCAIMLVKGDPRLKGRYFVSLGSNGILFKKPLESNAEFLNIKSRIDLQTFGTPQEALEAIQQNARGPS